MDCIFCNIIAGDIPSKKVFENEDVYAFNDINPIAPVHVLVIPKKHIPSVMGIQEEDQALIGKLHLAVQQVARETGVDQEGFRVVTNIGDHGQQTVHHLHYHVIGGRQLNWTM